MTKRSDLTTIHLAKGSPEAASDHITINQGLGFAEEFSVTDGAVKVPESKVADILGAFPGSTTDGGTPTADK